MEAREKARNASQDGDESVLALASLLTGLRAIDAPKTLIFISEGFILGENTGRSSNSARWRPPRARASMSLRLDTQMFDVTNARAPFNPFADRQAMTEGLEALAGASRGALFTVVGTGAALFDRIAAELSGYYLLGVESDGRDKDGKAHPIRVEVARNGALVRSRRQLVNAASRSAGAALGARRPPSTRCARRCSRRRCRCASRRSRCRGPSTARCSC